MLLQPATLVFWPLASAFATNPHLEGSRLQQEARQFLLDRPMIDRLPLSAWMSFVHDLGRYPEFAAVWLIALSRLQQGPQFADPADRIWIESEIRRLIENRLPNKERRKVLQEAALPWLDSFAAQLVSQEPDLYQLLGSRAPHPVALLLPIEGMRPGLEWIPFAETACLAGLDAVAIATAAIVHGMWGGSPEEIQGWMAELKKIEADRPRLAEVVKEALPLAEQRLAAALETRRRIEMKGLVAGG